MMNCGGLLVFLLCTGLGAVDSITVTSTKSVIEVARGDNVTLPCTYQSSTAPEKRKFTMARWNLINPNPEENPIEVIVYTTDELSTVGNQYTNRVSFVGDVEQGTASILLLNVHVMDNGTYRCEIIIPSDATGTKIAKASLLVLVAPSKPICQIVGTAEYGQNIQLTCKSEEGSPVPTYNWESYSPQNQPRPTPTSQEGGVLSLKNISMETSGFFICTAKNKIRSAACNVTLSVMPPSMNIALYAGVIGGIVGAIIILGIIIYCCCCRKEDYPEDYEMEEPEQQKDRPYDQVPSEEDGKHLSHETRPLPPPNKPKSLPRSDHEEA